MTDNDLHSRLVSSLTARLDRARAATRFWPGVRVESATRAEEDYVLANDPVAEIRRVEATLRVVQRHAPCSDCNGDGGDYVHATMCHACAEVGEYCGLVLALAAGEGIEP